MYYSILKIGKNGKFGKYSMKILAIISFSWFNQLHSKIRSTFK